MRKTLVIACAALTRELRTVLAPFGASVEVTYLPSPLHNRPDRITNAVIAVIDARAHEFDHIVVGYADCGTGGLLDAALAERNVSRLPGSHCYEFFTGTDEFLALHAAELGTFFLTDYLARHFDALVWQGMGLDRHPQLREMYFGNYVRVVLLTQSDDEALVAMGEAAAAKLGLLFEHRHTGLANFERVLHELVNEPTER